MDMGQACRVLFIREDRVELLKGEFSYPSIEGGDSRFNELYASLAEKSRKYIEERYSEVIREEYRGMSEADRKFRFRRYLYQFSCYVSSYDEKRLCVVCDVTLMRKGAGNLFASRNVQFWDLKTWRIVPAKYIFGVKTYKRLMKEENGGVRTDGLYFDGENAMRYSVVSASFVQTRVSG